MTLGAAVLLFLIVLIGIAAVSVYMRNKKTLRIFCMILLSFTALFLACYIGLTIIFVDAVRSKPPIP